MARGGGFAGGLELGQRMWTNAEASRRQNALDEERKWRFEQEKDAATRAATDRADYRYTQEGGLTGVTPNMTRAGPNGMGPVIDPRYIDIRAQRGQALDPATVRGLPPAAPAAAPVMDGGVPADPAVAPAGIPASGAGDEIPAMPAAPPASGAGAGTPATPPAAGLPPPGAGNPPAPGAGGFTDAEKEDRIAGIALRSGNVAGYRTARDSSKALKKQQLYDDYGKKLRDMTNEELFAEGKKYVTNNSGAAGTLGYDPKTRMFTIIHDTGAVQTIDPIQARAYLLAAFQMGNGDVEKGMASMMNVDTVRKAQERQNRTDSNALTEVVGKQAETVFKDNELQRFHKDEMAVKWAQLSESKAQHKGQKDRDARGSLITLQDKVTGEPVMGYGGIDDTGNATFKQIVLPESLRLPKDMSGTVNAKDITKFATDMVKDGTIDPRTTDKEGKNGKRYTLESATRELNDLWNKGDKTPQGVPIDPKASLDRLKAGSKGAASADSPRGLPPGPTVQQQMEMAKTPDGIRGLPIPAESPATQQQRAAAQDPELQTLEAQSRQALRANRSVEANNIIAKMMQMRQERYGF